MTADIHSAAHMQAIPLDSSGGGGEMKSVLLPFKLARYFNY